MYVHGAARLLAVRLGHEGRIHLVAQRRLAGRALEQKSLVGQIERIAVQQIDFHLCRTVFMDQRIDLDILRLAEGVEIIEHRIKLIDGGNAVGLPARFRATRTAHRRLELVVGVDIGLDQVELEFRCHHRLPATLRVEFQDVLQQLARRHRHLAPIRVETIVNHLRGGFRRPRHHPHGLRIGLEHDIDLGRAHRRPGVARIVTGHGLQKNALRQAHAGILRKFLGRHEFAARDARHVGNDGFDFRNAMVAEELLYLISHTSPTCLRTAAVPFKFAPDRRRQNRRTGPSRIHCP